MTRKTWKEFQESKLLWWINRQLHLFGWAIVLGGNEDGEILDAFPARVTFRGFPQQVDDDGFAGLTQHLAENINEISAPFEDDGEEAPCAYVKDSNEPCPTCPRLMSTLYRCGLLQETVREVEAYSDGALTAAGDEAKTHIQSE